MSLEKDLLNLEEHFWKGEHSFYRANVAEEGLMVFPPPAGILSKAEVMESVEKGQRWIDVAFDQVHFQPMTDDAILLVYQAAAYRSGQEGPYRAFISSLYVRDGENWFLAFHQQTPLGS